MDICKAFLTLDFVVNLGFGCRISSESAFQARILEWLPFPIPGGLPYPGIKSASLACLLHWQVASLPRVPSGKTPLFSLPLDFAVNLWFGCRVSSRMLPSNSGPLPPTAWETSSGKKATVMTSRDLLDVVEFRGQNSVFSLYLQPLVNFSESKSQIVLITS